MFRWIVAVCLVLITYGVLYHNLPCSMQLLDKTVYCQLQESVRREQEFKTAHHGKTRFDVALENWAKGLDKVAKRKPTASSGSISTRIDTPTGPEVSLPSAPDAQPDTVPPALIQRVDAEYTDEAVAAGLQGDVVLSAEVDATGHVVNPRVVRSLGLGLDEKAIEAVRQWRYRPATQDGQPVAFPMQIEFKFRLRNK